jgi:hypothetical protein
VILIEPDNAEALAWGIRDAVARGPMSAALRSTATGRFTVGQSVDALLELLSRHGHRSAPHLERELEAIIRLPSPPLRLPAPRGVRAETPAPA